MLDTLGPAAYNLNYFSGVLPNICVQDQFFLTRIKLRRHVTNFELNQLFRLTEGAVTSVFVTWINFMFYQWGEINCWPSRETVHFFAPTDFEAKYPNPAVVVDGTECPIMKPKQPLAETIHILHLQE